MNIHSYNCFKIYEYIWIFVREGEQLGNSWPQQDDQMDPRSLPLDSRTGGGEVNGIEAVGALLL